MNNYENIPTQLRQNSGYGRLILLALWAILVAAVGKPAPTQAADTRTAVVSLVDLDLATDQDMQIARNRVHETARKLCEKVINPWSRSRQTDYTACVDETAANALGQIERSTRLASAKLPTKGVSTH